MSPTVAGNSLGALQRPRSMCDSIQARLPVVSVAAVAVAVVVGGDGGGNVG